MHSVDVSPRSFESDASPAAAAANIVVAVRLKPLLAECPQISGDSQSPTAPPQPAAQQPMASMCDDDGEESQPFAAWEAACEENDTGPLQRVAVTNRFATKHRRPLHSYAFDAVYEGISTEPLYTRTIQRLVDGAIDGHNALIFAYGQTCSGKTFTMLGSPANPGIVPLAVHDIFRRISNECAVDPKAVFTLKYSYVEIHNEKIIDLLEGDAESAPRLIEGGRHGPTVSGATLHTATAPEAICAAINACEKERHVRQTDFNERSSRSHAILQIFIERSGGLFGGGDVQTSSVTLIDLAGSERASITSPDSLAKRQETAFINRSLLSLVNVIAKLTNEKTRSGHIPYRDSKLTRLLQGALSAANTRICVVCTVKKDALYFDESHRTLLFGQKMKFLVAPPSPKGSNPLFFTDRQTIQRCQQEIGNLKAKIAALCVEVDKIKELKREKELIVNSLARLADEQQHIFNFIKDVLVCDPNVQTVTQACASVTASASSSPAMKIVAFMKQLQGSLKSYHRSPSEAEVVPDAAVVPNEKCPAEPLISPHPAPSNASLKEPLEKLPFAVAVNGSDVSLLTPPFNFTALVSGSDVSLETPPFSSADFLADRAAEDDESAKSSAFSAPATPHFLLKTSCIDAEEAAPLIETETASSLQDGGNLGDAIEKNSTAKATSQMPKETYRPSHALLTLEQEMDRLAKELF